MEMENQARVWLKYLPHVVHACGGVKRHREPVTVKIDMGHQSTKGSSEFDPTLIEA